MTIKLIAGPPPCTTAHSAQYPFQYSELWLDIDRCVCLLKKLTCIFMLGEIVICV